MLIVITCACDKYTFNSLRNSNSYFFISRSFELSPKPLKFEFLALGFELSRVRLCVTPNGAAYVNVGTKRNSVEWKKKKKTITVSTAYNERITDHPPGSNLSHIDRRRRRRRRIFSVQQRYAYNNNSDPNAATSYFFFTEPSAFYTSCSEFDYEIVCVRHRANSPRGCLGRKTRPYHRRATSPHPPNGPPVRKEFVRDAT